jgi:phosphohistidine phosphatase
MQILLIRHGNAVEEAPGLGDAGRWLSAKGRKITRKVARWLGKSAKRRPSAIWTSQLVRSVQTAEILAAGVEYEGEVKPCAELSPGRDPGDLIKLLANEPADATLALVGHEPSLSLIAGALLGDIGFTGFKKSAVMALVWADGKGELRFVLDPAEMKARKHIKPAAAVPASEEPDAG